MAAKKRTRSRRGRRGGKRWDGARTDSPLTHGQRALLWVGALFLFHALGLALLYSPISGLFNDQPIIEQDWGLHFHHLRSTDGFWRHDGRLWGYNPFFMAGYPSNTIQDLSIKLFELLSLLATTLGLELVQAFKLIVFMSMASVPWIMFFTARNFFDSETIAPIAALLGTAYWWNSLPREMFFYGMIGFSLSSYFSLLVLSLLYRMLKSQPAPTPTHWAWLAAAAVILPLHLQAVLILAPPAIALLVAHRKSLSPRTLLRIEPEKILDDPIPFIKIIKPSSEFTLRVGG